MAARKLCRAGSRPASGPPADWLAGELLGRPQAGLGGQSPGLWAARRLARQGAAWPLASWAGRAGGEAGAVLYLCAWRNDHCNCELVLFIGLTIHTLCNIWLSSLTTWRSMDSKTDAPVLGRATHFYRSNAPGASVFVKKGHLRASVFQNVGVEGHPFSQNGHPFCQNAILGGHQALPVAPFKILKGNPAEHSF